MAKKIIVIGSGFGGLAASLRLKAKGYKVTLIEKHPDLGGRARVFKKGDFIYDGGPTVITAPHLFEELFSMFNKKISDYVKNRKVDKMYLYILINILKLILRTFSIISYFSVGHLFKIRGAERRTERDRDILVARVRVMKLTGTSGWQSTARMGQVQVPAPEYGGFATGMASRRRS